MFEIVVTFLQLITHQQAQYVSIQKFDTEEHCNKATNVLDPIITEKLENLPFDWKGSCEFFNNT